MRWCMEISQSYKRLIATTPKFTDGKFTAVKTAHFIRAFIRCFLSVNSVIAYAYISLI